MAKADHRLQEQSERLYEVFAELVREYQFRDREQVCCHGLSISQCHALEMLSTRGAQTMGDIARSLFLEGSTVTRVVDRLVEDGLAERNQDPHDRRVWRVEATDRGNQVFLTIQSDLLNEHIQILRELPEHSRETVISTLNGLLKAFRARQSQACSDKEKRCAT